MGELLEGWVNFAAEAAEVIGKINDTTEPLKNFGEVADMVFSAFGETGLIGKVLQNVLEDIKSIGPALAAADSKHGLPATKPRDDEHSETAKNLDRLDHSSYKPEFTSLEKMGFIMSGSKVQNPYEQRQVDLLQQIANNTSQLSNAFHIIMPDNKHLRDPIDPSPFISNIV